MSALAIARLEIPAHTSAGIEQTAGDESTVSLAIERVVSFIPTEVLTLYLALLALVDSIDEGVEWAISAICLILAPVAVFVAHMERKTSVNRSRKADGKAPVASGTPIWPMAAAALSFALWVIVMPGTVVASVSFYNRRGALIVLLLGEFGLGLVGRIRSAKGRS